MTIPKIPRLIRNFDSSEIKQHLDSENIKENISKIREETAIDERISKIREETAIDERISKIRGSETFKHYESSDDDSGFIMIGGAFSAEEKERTVLILQILSALFIVLSILSIFNFISAIIYIPLGIVVVGYIVYLIYNKIKLMYKSDFNAYRDFFLMYIAVGVILYVINFNTNLVMSFSFEVLPSLTVLIFALVAVIAVFLIFRVRYYRNFTYGTVLDSGKNTAHVKVDYDIRSNVKPDIYIVENHIGAVEGEQVKLQLEEKLMSMSGNRPVNIIETANRI
ncbi:DUF2101 family protein [Methanobacterium lacus]|nr:DUF2101 family protein [Methanobacterium lacus]